MTDHADSSKIAGSSMLGIALAWVVVVLPAAWGVYNTVLRAANLFH
jgi:hypothetical protein